MPAITVIAMAEDTISAAIVERLFNLFEGKYYLLPVKITKGTGELDKSLPGWSQAAANSLALNTMFFVLRDLDKLAYPQDALHCPQTETEKLLKELPRQNNLLLRFAVAEAENWLLADADNLRAFLKVRDRTPINADEILNGKEEILRIACGKSRNRQYRQFISRGNDNQHIGSSYNRVLTEFIRTRWEPRRAAKNSKSLGRTLACLERYA